MSDNDTPDEVEADEVSTQPDALPNPLYASPQTDEDDEGSKQLDGPPTARFTEAPRVVSEATAEAVAAHEEQRDEEQGQSAYEAPEPTDEVDPD